MIALKMLLVVMLVMAAPTLWAADCTQAGNLLTNCGFDVDLSWWNIATADASAHIPDDGAFALGSVEIDRHDGIHALEIFSGCLAVTPSSEYDFGVSHRLVTGPFVQRCFLDIWEHDNAACVDFLAAASVAFTPVLSWSEVFDRHQMSAETESILLRLVCSYGKNDFVIRLDDFLFGENLISPVIFNDGFESGFTGVWSSQTP